MRKSRGHLFIHSECDRVISDRRVEEDSMCLRPKRQRLSGRNRRQPSQGKYYLQTLYTPSNFYSGYGQASTIMNLRNQNPLALHLFHSNWEHLSLSPIQAMVLNFSRILFHSIPHYLTCIPCNEGEN